MRWFLEYYDVIALFVWHVSVQFVLSNRTTVLRATGECNFFFDALLVYGVKKYNTPPIVHSLSLVTLRNFPAQLQTSLPD